MNRFIMMIEDAAFSVLELVTIGLCLYEIAIFWSLTP